MTILVTGGNGFVGKHLCNRLKANKLDYFAPKSKDYNLLCSHDVYNLFYDTKPKRVIHLAATVGGIGANKINPGKFIYENLQMGINMIEASRKSGVEKFVMLGTVCSYPKHCPVPFCEENIWNGYPEETNAPYGIAKKALMEMIAAYKRQYGFNGVNLVPCNMYGACDNFDPITSHVIPAIILKVHNAIKNKDKEIVVWGTGEASREFLYVDDCVDAILLALKYCEISNPINIGTGQEIKIKDLVSLICNIMGFKGSIVYDKSKPDGQPRRSLDTHMAKVVLRFEAKTKLEYGLKQTIGWYKNGK